MGEKSISHLSHRSMYKKAFYRNILPSSPTKTWQEISELTLHSLAWQKAHKCSLASEGSLLQPRMKPCKSCVPIATETM